MAHKVVSKILKEHKAGERDVVLLDIGGKLRPAVCLRKMPHYGDLLVCAVTTQLDQYIEAFDEIVEPNEIEGIKKKSVIRLGCLERVESHAIPGSMGMIPAVQHRRLLKKLSDYLTGV